MPLSPLHTINPHDMFWQGWASFLTEVPTLPNQEGTVAEWLNNIKPSGFPKTFVPQANLPPSVAYESFIFEQDKIPTRDGLHDFFNALCWINFPQTKHSFNRIHQNQIAQLGTTQRGKVRDMLTVIDENGFLIQCPDELWLALKQKQWIHAFINLRHLWNNTKVMVFGHALLEKLVNPYKAITAHSLRIPSDLILSSNPHTFTSKDLAKLDAYLANFLTEDTLASKPYIPLQIFGIPGWSKDKQNLAFYQDTQVFRQASFLEKTKR